MGLLSWFRRAIAPTKIVGGSPRVVREKPLWEQFTRIGGGLTPADVSNIIREADGGQPARLYDLGNESRQKDGHLQGILGTREGAVGLSDLDFVLPEDATPEEKRGRDLCRRIVDEFDEWPDFIDHLSGAFVPGHATAELLWENLPDGALLPVRHEPMQSREFIFAQKNGKLRYARAQGDMVGIDLLAENPGRIIQVTRRITGDVPAREGLVRIIVWAALLRNWTLRDWVALGEIGWKPWRTGEYEPGTDQKDIDALTTALEETGAKGVGVYPSNTKLNIEWPAGQRDTTSSHNGLFQVLGYELSKGVLGQTTSTEPGPNGDRASTQTRDQVRLDIRERDARAVAAALRSHLFAPAVALNIGDRVRVAVPWFQTDDATDQVKFSEAVAKLAPLMDIPDAWVRDNMGMPVPAEGDVVLKSKTISIPKPNDPKHDGKDDADDDPKDEAA